MIREELLSMTPDDLQKYLKEQQDALTDLRFQKALQQLEESNKIRNTRREIAQIKTLLKEYELGRREIRGE